MNFPRLALPILPALASLGSPARARISVDRTDARATARAVTVAFRARDLAALAQLSTEDNRCMLANIAAKGEAHPRYSSIFRGWRWGIVQTWNGTRGREHCTKAGPPKRARVEFHKMGREVATAARLR